MPLRPSLCAACGEENQLTRLGYVLDFFFYFLFFYFGVILFDRRCGCGGTPSSCWLHLTQDCGLFAVYVYMCVYVYSLASFICAASCIVTMVATDCGVAVHSMSRLRQGARALVLLGEEENQERVTSEEDFRKKRKRRRRSRRRNITVIPTLLPWAIEITI